MNDKKYVIGLTGATGAIGQAFVRHLSQRSGVEVFALVRGQPAPTGSNMHLIPGDLLNKNVLEQLVTKSDVIVHLAACNPRTPEQDIKEMNVFFSTNGCATVALAKLAAHYAKRFVHSSSVAVYELSERNRGSFSEEEPLPGRPVTQEWLGAIRQDMDRIVTEWIDGKIGDIQQATDEILAAHSPPNESIYALSKYLGERLVTDRSESIVLRFSDVYGPRDLSDRIIPNVLRALVNGEKVTIDFGPREIVSLVYMGDVMLALEVAATVDSLSSIPQVINVAFPTTVTENELVRHLQNIASEAGTSSSIEVSPRSQSATSRDSRTYSTKRMQRHLGITDPIPLSKGLRQLFSYIQRQRAVSS